jgi:replication-associated recombination protein RarA
MAVAAKSNAVYRAYSAAAEAASKNSQSRFRSPAKRATR